VLYDRKGDGLGTVLAPYELSAMNDMLRAVVTIGTGRNAAFEGHDIAGKTGTSQEYRDAWFVGYSAQLVAGVWAGNDDNSPTKEVTGGSVPAMIWKDVMEPAHATLAALALPGDLAPQAPGSEVPVAQEERSQQPRQVSNEGGFFGLLQGMFGGSRSVASEADAPTPRQQRRERAKTLKELPDSRR
jgi:penicillin-binding protein 1A